MPRRALGFEAGSYYHVYNRGHNRGTVFLERAGYVFFLRRLRDYLLPKADVVAYCLMPTHYHLLVGLRDDDLSRCMQLLAVSYAKAVNERFGRVGSLFQGPFQAKRVDRDEYLLHLSRYIHRNPVKAGLCSPAEAWEFSSYGEYIGVRPRVLAKPDIVLSQFRSPEDYRLFVEAYADEEPDCIAHLLFE